MSREHDPEFLVPLDASMQAFNGVQNLTSIKQECPSYDQRRHSIISSNTSYLTASFPGSCVDTSASELSFPTTPSGEGSAWRNGPTTPSYFLPNTPSMPSATICNVPWPSPPGNHEASWSFEHLPPSSEKSFYGTECNALESPFETCDPLGATDWTEPPVISTTQHSPEDTNFIEQVDCNPHCSQETWALVCQRQLDTSFPNVEPNHIRRRERAPRTRKNRSSVTGSPIEDKPKPTCSGLESESGGKCFTTELKRMKKCHYCGDRFRRSEHRKRHERIHQHPELARQFSCSLSLEFGDQVCQRASKPINDRGDNLTQHTATHCYGYAKCNSRNAIFHKNLVGALLRHAERFERGKTPTVEQREERIASMMKQLKNKMHGKNEDSHSPLRCKVNAHIDHSIMSQLCPEGFVSCENFGNSTHLFFDDWYRPVDRQVAWCHAWIPKGPKPGELPLVELPLSSDLNISPLVQRRRGKRGTLQTQAQRTSTTGVRANL